MSEKLTADSVQRIFDSLDSIDNLTAKWYTSYPLCLYFDTKKYNAKWANFMWRYAQYLRQRSYEEPEPNLGGMDGV